MATASHARAVKSLNKSPGRGRFVVSFLSFFSVFVCEPACCFAKTLNLAVVRIYFVFELIKNFVSQLSRRFCWKFVLCILCCFVLFASAFFFLILKTLNAQFKSFSDRVDEIDINVYRSLEKVKAEPSEGSSFFRDCLIEWRVCSKYKIIFCLFAFAEPYSAVMNCYGL